MKAAIYARTSLELQSTASQINLCREYITEKGGQIAGIYDDPGVSASDTGDGLNLLIEDAKNRKFDTIVVADISRISRNRQQAADFIDTIGRHGIEFVVAKTLESENR